MWAASKFFSVSQVSDSPAFTAVKQSAMAMRKGKFFEEEIAFNESYSS